MWPGAGMSTKSSLLATSAADSLMGEPSGEQRTLKLLITNWLMGD